MAWKHGKFLDKCCQQQLSQHSPSPESFSCIQTTNPTLFLEKQRGDWTEIYIGIFYCEWGMGMPRNLRKDYI